MTSQRDETPVTPADPAAAEIQGRPGGSAADEYQEVPASRPVPEDQGRSEDPAIPAGQGAASVTEPAPATESAPAAEPGAAEREEIPAAALAEQQWPGILAQFVDDPRGSVERAAATAREIAAAFTASLEREQVRLRTTWQDEPDTEKLRTAVQQYRAFCGRLEGLS